MRLHTNIQSGVILLLTFFVIPVFYICVAASVGISYDVYSFTFPEAYERARLSSIGEVLQDGYARFLLGFIPFSIVICLTFLCFRNSRLSDYALIAAILVPAIFCPFSLFEAFNLPRYLTSDHEGETWGEAWPAISCLGLWVLVFSLLGIYRWKTRNVELPETEKG